eukprot:Gregarina_sp_Poly_1__9767@NODE_622_length_7094_cov_92_849580_g477_i0_p5_GENE_NODE_622_length_7094_cov_92_849580_g477_i0NODE_622_length_7094_cov_92_849580_g477_i0_p5_ORF_typecomplete_len209_score16_86Thymidylate_kin/PF02223_17/1_3e42AAA_33/PF13671_6/0_0019CPT/PF07931_12/0_0088AAA_28/PF13521_6/0_015APS_kinase/PF01583_20/0_034PPK2/PF03976_14/0_19PPK2/PF03976_14/1_1e03KTI12/PF08433_10/0_13_NODE_622_length_7094_cov_92_849580_g477_i056682
MRGLFVVFEGLDKSGKTTQSRLLVERLQAERGLDQVVQIQFPDRATKVGSILHEYLKGGDHDIDPHCAHLLFSANRWEWHQKLRKLLESGVTVICDRYAHSGVAYSVGALRFDPAWCLSPDKGLIAPDVVYYLSLPENSSALEDRKDPDVPKERYELTNLQQKVKAEFDKFETLSRKANDDIWVKINALESTTVSTSWFNDIVALDMF